MGLVGTIGLPYSFRQKKSPGTSVRGSRPAASSVASSSAVGRSAVALSPAFLENVSHAIPCAIASAISIARAGTTGGCGGGGSRTCVRGGGLGSPGTGALAGGSDAEVALLWSSRLLQIRQGVWSSPSASNSRVNAEGPARAGRASRRVASSSSAAVP
eukprot:scaffold74371_cov69-Phaeocystis_antarctica.AAC.5